MSGAKRRLTKSGSRESGVDSVAAAGGAGGTAIEVIPFPSGTNVAVTVGAAGNAPGTGGTSSFGAYCSATGGAGGSPGSGTGGESGVGSGGQINLNGGSGDYGTDGPVATGGAGGSSYWGGGGGVRRNGANTPANANKGQAYGSGGGGGFSSISPNFAAGTGKAGIVVVE